MVTLELDLEALSPLFLGGADQQPDLRPPAFRGALRHWYRAIDPDFCRPVARGGPPREGIFFGGIGTGQGQSPWLLRIRADGPVKTMEWLDRDALNAFNDTADGTGIDTKNGVKYLGYTLDLGRDKLRVGIVPGTRFRARCVIPNPARLGDDGFRALIGAWWMLTHVGGVGTRCRRGFGSIHLRAWSLNGRAPKGWQEVMDALPLTAHAPDLDAWHRAFSEGLQKIGGLFPGEHSPKAPDHLGPGTRAILIERNHPIDGRDPWAWALQDAGLLFQRFRSKREPDYGRVKAHARYLERIPSPGPSQPSAPLTGEAPERAAFGLPLTFRFPYLGKKRVNTAFELSPAGVDSRGTSMTRHPAPLWIRVVKVGSALMSLITRLDGALPGTGSGIAVGRHAGGRPLAEPSGDILDALLDDALANKIKFPGQAISLEVPR